MIAVDTNVLVRLLVADQLEQAAKARQLFDEADAQGEALWIADTVLVELVWTLTRSYSRVRAEVVDALQALLSHDTVTLESPAAVLEATERYASGRADFADCLLCAKALAAGCERVATFDRGMKSLTAVRLL